MVIYSFEVLLIDGNWWVVDYYWDIVIWGGWMFIIVLVFVLVLLIVMLVINMLFGVMICVVL